MKTSLTSRNCHQDFKTSTVGKKNCASLSDLSLNHPCSHCLTGCIDKFCSRKKPKKSLKGGQCSSRLFLCLVPPRHSKLRSTSLNCCLLSPPSPSSVARACHPSGGIKVVWMFGEGSGPGPVVCLGWPARSKLVVASGGLGESSGPPWT